MASVSLGHRLEYVLFQSVSRLFGILPLKWVRSIAFALGSVGWHLGIRRKVVMENLFNAFPGESVSRLSAIGRKATQNVAVSLCELLWFPHLRAETIPHLVEFTDQEMFRSCHARGKGIVIVTAHLGNWEFIPLIVHRETGISVNSVYKPQSNILIDSKILIRRRLFGTNVFPMGLGIRDILRSLHQGEAILVAADQSAPKESIRLTFFGRSVPVFQGPAAFSLKTGAAMISAFAIRQPDGSYKLRCEEIPFGDLKNDDDGIRELSRRHVALTEAVIREYPDQWMWTHRRWKHAAEEGVHEED